MNLKEYLDWVVSWKINANQTISEYFEKAKKSLDEKENIYLRLNNNEKVSNNNWALKWAPIAI